MATFSKGLMIAPSLCLLLALNASFAQEDPLGDGCCLYGRSYRRESVAGSSGIHRKFNLGDIQA